MGGIHANECCETKMAPRDHNGSISLQEEDEEDDEYEDESQISGSSPAVSSQPVVYRDARGRPMAAPAEGPPALQEWLRSGGKRTTPLARQPSYPAPPPVPAGKPPARQQAAPRGRGGAFDQRPDPTQVAHVTVDQHLDVVDCLEEATRLNAELTREAQELRQHSTTCDDQLLRTRAERDALARELENTARERDRFISENAQRRLELTETSCENERLRRELVDAQLLQQALEGQNQEACREVGEARAQTERMERKWQQMKRQLQSLRGLACPECRMRADEMDAVEDFFDEAPQARPGKSCYGQALPTLSNASCVSNSPQWRAR